MVQKKLLAIGDVRAWVSGQGPAVVFCHGFTTTSEFWRSQAEELSATHTVVCVNLPGHGISPAPRERAYTMAAFVDDLHAVFTTLGLKDAVLVRIPKQECQPVRKQKCHLSPSIDVEIKIFFPIKYLIEAKRKCHRPSYQSAWTSF